MVMFYTYVLRSLKNGRQYTGSTGNLERRLAEHNQGKTKSIKFNGLFELIYKEPYNSRLEAVRREMFLKSGKGREYLRNILGA